MRLHQRSAFSLVEILIVIVLLAILAAAVIPQFADSTDSTKSSVMLYNLSLLRRQIAVYQAQHHGQFPDNTIATQLISQTNSDGTTSGTPSLGPYLAAIPANPHADDPVQSLIQVVSSDPSQNITTHGWIYNSNDGKIFSATDILK